MVSKMFLGVAFVSTLAFIAISVQVGRQVEGATAGITVNQGLFGHGSSVLLTT